MGSIEKPAVGSAVGKWLPLLIASTGLWAGCAGQTHPPENYTSRVQIVDDNDIRAWTDEGREFILVDVRSEGEYDSEGRAPGSELHTWSIYNRDPARNQAFLDEMTEGFDRNATIVLLCSHAMRASQAAAALTEQRGFTDVYVFAGGYEGHYMDGYPSGKGWKAAGLPIEEW